MIDIFLHADAARRGTPDFTIDEEIPSGLRDLLATSQRLLIPVRDLEEIARSWVSDAATGLLATLAGEEESHVVTLVWR